MGIKRSKQRPGSAKSPRWGWSGVGRIVPPPASEAELVRVVDLLPGLQTPVEGVVAQLRAIGGRYARYLHQDEFGPTRAEQMQALRHILVPLEELASRLARLPDHLRLLLSEKLAGYCSSTAQLNADPFASYSADRVQIEAVSERASDICQTLVDGDKTSEATLIEEVHVAATGFTALLCNIDTTSEGEVIFDATRYLQPENSTDALDGASAAIHRMRDRFDLALSKLKRRKGTEPRASFVWLVWQLCDLWRRETGSPVTANPVKGGAYTGRPQSASGRFVCAAVEALQPVFTCVGEQTSPVAAMRAETITRAPGFRVQAVHTAMRRYIADASPTDSAVPRRGRPRKKVTL